MVKQENSNKTYKKTKKELEVERKNSLAFGIHFEI